MQYWGFSSLVRPDFNTQGVSPVLLRDLASPVTRSGLERGLFGERVSETLNQLLSSGRSFGGIGEEYRQIVTETIELFEKARGEVFEQVVGDNQFGDYDISGIRDTAKLLKAKATSESFSQKGKTLLSYVAHGGGFDTHRNQASGFSLDAKLGRVANNLAVFIEDLKSFGAWEDTVILLFSEFGRTTFENGADGDLRQGTDHGWGSNTVILGGAIPEGVIGETPSQAAFLDSDLNAVAPTIDYRDIFSDVFAWMGIDNRQVFDEPAYRPSPLGIFS